MVFQLLEQMNSPELVEELQSQFWHCFQVKKIEIQIPYYNFEFHSNAICIISMSTSSLGKVIVVKQIFYHMIKH